MCWWCLLACLLLSLWKLNLKMPDAYFPSNHVINTWHLSPTALRIVNRIYAHVYRYFSLDGQNFRLYSFNWRYMQKKIISKSGEISTHFRKYTFYVCGKNIFVSKGCAYLFNPYTLWNFSIYFRWHNNDCFKVTFVRKTFLWFHEILGQKFAYILICRWQVLISYWIT